MSRIGEAMNVEPVVFTGKDFDGAGQYIVRGNPKYPWEKFVDGGRASTFIYKIGYDHEVVYDKEGNLLRQMEEKYNMISMADGWSRNVGTKEQLAEELNNSNETRYRWATEDELILMIKAQAVYRVKG